MSLYVAVLCGLRLFSYCLGLAAFLCPDVAWFRWSPVSEGSRMFLDQLCPQAHGPPHHRPCPGLVTGAGHHT